MRKNGCHTCVQRCLCIGVVFEFFFVIIIIIIIIFHLRICTEPVRFGQNRVVSAESDCISRRPKLIETARTSWNRPWMRPKHPKYVLSQFHFEYLLLLFCFIFCFVFLAFFFLCFVNQWHIMCFCFLRIF